MLIIPPPMSNAERQRRFRERNPGYYARIQARKRASAKRGAALILAKVRAELAAKETAAKAAAAMPAAKPMLMLPVPAELPQISAGINVILVAEREAETRNWFGRHD